MLFLREAEAQPLDTPEQRAGLERRLADVVAGIGDDTLRRHYQADMRRRLDALFGVDRSAPARRFRPYGQASGDARRRFFPPQGPRVGVAETPLPPQEKLGRKARDPARETAILAVLIGHPTLIETHWEEAAAMEFESKRLSAFRDALVAVAPEALQSPEALAEALSAAGRAEERERILGVAARMPNWWCSRRGGAFRRRAGAAPEPGLASSGGRVK